MTDGLTRQDFSGSFRRYLDALYFYNETANNIRVWSEKVFIFSDRTLITVLDVPQKYKAKVNNMMKKYKSLEGNTNA